MAVATQVQHHYRDKGPRLIPLAAVSDPLLMATTIIGSIAPGDMSAKLPQSRLIELLRHRTLLLVLDNLEQDRGARLLSPHCWPNAPILDLAGREQRLHLRVEQRFAVQPLELSATVDLFVRRVQAVEDGFCLTDENQSSIAAICAQLDCLPLALELYAAQIELFSRQPEILSQLRANLLDLLADGAHDLPERHRALRYAIHRSYDLLQTEEQTLLRRLGIFVGGFDLGAVEAISAQTPSSGDDNHHTVSISPTSNLHALLARSLVRTETLPNGEKRFFLLETIRQFALEQARYAEQEEALRQRHYAIYLALFRMADDHLRGPEALAWFARLQPEYDNLRAAIRWTLNQGHYEDTAWLILVALVLRLQGHWIEQLGWVQG